MYIDFQNVAEMILAIMIVIGGFFLAVWAIIWVADNWDAILEFIVMVTVLAIVFLTLYSLT
jgi:uncharacterized membrane protein